MSEQVVCAACGLKQLALLSSCARCHEPLIDQAIVDTDDETAFELRPVAPTWNMPDRKGKAAGSRSTSSMPMPGRGNSLSARQRAPLEVADATPREPSLPPDGSWPSSDASGRGNAAQPAPGVRRVSVAGRPIGSRAGVPAPGFAGSVPGAPMGGSAAGPYGQATGAMPMAGHPGAHGQSAGAPPTPGAAGLLRGSVPGSAAPDPSQGGDPRTRSVPLAGRAGPARTGAMPRGVPQGSAPGAPSVPYPAASAVAPLGGRGATGAYPAPATGTGIPAVPSGYGQGPGGAGPANPSGYPPATGTGIPAVPAGYQPPQAGRPRGPTALRPPPEVPPEPPRRAWQRWAVAGVVVLVVALAGVDTLRVLGVRSRLQRTLDANIPPGGIPTPDLPRELQRALAEDGLDGAVISRWSRIRGIGNLYDVGVELKQRVVLVPIRYAVSRQGNYPVAANVKTMSVYEAAGWELDPEAQTALARYQNRER